MNRSFLRLESDLINFSLRIIEWRIKIWIFIILRLFNLISAEKIWIFFTNFLNFSIFTDYLFFFLYFFHEFCIRKVKYSLLRKFMLLRLLKSLFLIHSDRLWPEIWVFIWMKPRFFSLMCLSSCKLSKYLIILTLKAKENWRFEFELCDCKTR